MTDKKEKFEADHLDGDKLEDCGGAMFSAKEVFNIIQETRQELLTELEEKSPKEKYVPEMCKSDEKTLADISYDRGFNSCLKQIRSIIKDLKKIDEGMC